MAWAVSVSWGRRRSFWLGVAGYFLARRDAACHGPLFMDGAQGAGARGEVLRGDLAGSHAREKRARVDRTEARADQAEQRADAMQAQLAVAEQAAAQARRQAQAAQFAAEAIAMASARVEASRASRSRWQGLRGFRAWLYRHTVIVASVMAAAVWVFAGLVLGYIWAG